MRRRWVLSGRAALVAVVAAAAVAAAALAVTARPGGSSPIAVVTDASVSDSSVAETSDPLQVVSGAVVHVAGAVEHPGLYTLEPGARVADAIDAAGGTTPDAVEGDLNLAREVSDGEQVRVPSTTDPDADGPGPVNLNRANAADLEALPGVGPVLAARIVADRDVHGPFASLADLARVPGVGQAIVTGLDGLATV